MAGYYQDYRPSCAGRAAAGLPPRSLPGPPLSLPGVTSLVDQSRSWRVPMPLARLTAWLRAHRPRELDQDGASSGWGPAGITVIGYGYAGPGRPAWQSAELDLSVAPAGSGASVLRADGVVVWLDPVPVRDRRRVRGCE